MANLSTVTIQLDHKPENNYDLMVLRTAHEAVERAGLKASLEDGAPAVLIVSLKADKADAFVVFNMEAELKCRSDNSKEVCVWRRRQEEVAKLRPSALGNIPPTVLRTKVSSFYTPFIKEYKQAAAAAKQP